MILHMLGGGPAQLSIIRRIKELGYQAAVSDMNPAAPGLILADFPSHASSFDADAVAKEGKRIGSDCFLTSGTDQPVLTCTRASEKLGKSYFLTPRQALMVTNKRVMKRAMKERGIPTRKFVLLRKNFSPDQLKNLQFPLVIKPLDSQGQRGVLKVDSLEDIRRSFDWVLGFSRENEILAEEYYPGEEVTVSGWVEGGRAYILSITDRVTIDNGPHLGVCVSHRYPSLCHDKWDELSIITHRLKEMIGMENGPLYFQILHGKEGFFVNEIACRLGGAYEDEFLPWLSGVPLLDFMIEMTAGKPYNRDVLEKISQRREGKYLSLQMFFSRPGFLTSQRGMEEILTLPGIINGRFLLEPGTEILERENSSQRAGYFIVTGASKQEINSRIKEAYGKISMMDNHNREMIEFHENMLFP
jgi:biotin carboxylase